MNEDELGRLLGEALDAQARAQVPDAAPVTPARFEVAPPRAADPRHGLAAGHRPGSPRSRRRRVAIVAAPLLAAAAVVAVVLGVLSATRGTVTTQRAAGGPASSTGAGAPASAAPRAGSGRPVTIRILNTPGATVGVGMPVVALFSARFGEAADLSRATTVTVDGRRADAAWYFAPASGHPGFPIEGHLRLQEFWPAYATIRVTVAARGISAGTGWVFADAARLSFRTGASNIATVNDLTHTLTLVTNGRVAARYPVSLGAASTPTDRGTKVVMAKGVSICMSGPGYSECGIKDTQQLTLDGEYLHAAPWNMANIGHRDTSNGCTNLTPVDAAALYRTMRVGDVVEYPNADGPLTAFSDGLGDWDVSWSTWLTGGAITTA